MAIDVTEATFQSEVLDASVRVPVVVDFWAEWCGPCRTLGPVLERAADAHGAELVLAKVDVDANPGLGARYGVKGIPAVKAFRDGEVTGEFTGAQPPAQVEAFMASLLPSRTDELIEAGDERALREAVNLEPGRADAVLALAKILRARGERADADEALELLGSVAGSFEADGLVARIRLAESDAEAIAEAVVLLDEAGLEPGLDALLDALPAAGPEQREEIRVVIVGALSELAPDDPRGRDYRRRLAGLLY